MEASEDVPHHDERVAEIGYCVQVTVYKLMGNPNDGRFVTLKQVRMRTDEEGVPASTLREVARLRYVSSFEHPNIVRLFDVFSTCPSDREMRLTLVFEFIDQDLSRFLKEVPPPGLPERRIRDMMQQILNGLDFLYLHQVVHENLKPQNILMTSSGQLKIAEIGMARNFNLNMTRTTVIISYHAPEILMLQAHYGSPVDLWSVGCIFAELHSLRPLFDGTTVTSQLEKIFQFLRLSDEDCWPEDILNPHSCFAQQKTQPIQDKSATIGATGKDLLLKLLTFDPRKRISAFAALQHEFFSKTDESAAKDLTPDEA